MFSLIILRGSSGSGKSSVARMLAQGCDSVICSADDYFMEDGVYRFVPSELSRAHQLCQEIAERAMKQGTARVIIDNCNTQEQHMAPYEKLAKKYGYMTFHMIIENRHGNKSNKCPEYTVERHERDLRSNLRLR